MSNLEKIYGSGIVDFLSNKYNRPKSIILFGSFSKGEDIENSDIDIAVSTNKRLNLDISKYEKIIRGMKRELKKLMEKYQLESNYGSST